MTNSKSSGDNGFESSDGWEVEDEVEIPNGNGEADNNNMEANFEAICDTARYVLLSSSWWRGAIIDCEKHCNNYRSMKIHDPGVHNQHTAWTVNTVLVDLYPFYWL